jgi:DNA-binding winged helix-turn-helix (wHTH) protein/TolB-like protein/Tfp pilus assembly protein PilF
MEKPWKDLGVVTERDFQRIFEFGSFRLDTSECRLYRDGKIVPLTPKIFDILVVLVERNGQLVEKERLMQIIWPDTYVEEGNLVANISILRKALGESQGKSQFVETIPKRGYRFIAPVKVFTKSPTVDPQNPLPNFRDNSDLSPGHDHLTQSGSSSGHRIRSWTGARSQWRRLLAATAIAIGLGVGLGFYVYKRIFRADAIQSQAPAFRALAILPFQTMGMPANEEYLGLGLADALITDLSHYKGLVVRPTSAIHKFQAPGSDPLQAGRTLGVDLALTGKIQREGSRLRVTMQLLQVNNKDILWSDKFDGQVSEMFALQDSLSRRLARTLIHQFPGQIDLKQQPGGHNEHYQPKNEAHLAFLNGRYHIYSYTLGGWEKSRRFLTEATNIDPNYALAYAGLAEAYTIAAELYLSPHEAWPKAHAAAERAIALDGNLSEAYTSLAIVKALYQRDWKEAEQAFAQATALNPQLAMARDWYGWFLLWRGRFDESLAQFREAQRLDPLSPFIGTDLGTHFYCLRKYDQAETELKKLVEMHADNFSANSMLGWVYAKQGRSAEAIAVFEKTRKIDNTPMAVAALAYAQARAGNRAPAKQLLAELRQRSNNEYISPFAYVLIYLGLGDKDQIFAWLERAYDTRSLFMITLKVDPLFDQLRSDPRYDDLLRRLNLSS